MLFKYKENVVINSGFFEGQKGTIINVSSSWWTIKYKVYFSDIPNEWFKEKYIDSLDFPNKRFSKKLNKIIE